MPKITALPLAASVTDTDLLAVVVDPGGTPVTKRATVATVLAHVAAAPPPDLSACWPVGSVFLSVVATNPADLLGFGTWTAFGAGRVLVGRDGGDPAFDVLEETGGTKTVQSTGTVSAPTFTGTPFTQVINHTHAVAITDPGHTHTLPVGATDDTGAPFDRADAGTNASGANATTASGSATSGITATTANPAGGVASITPAGTVSQPTFTGNATSVVQPYVVVQMWTRVA